MSVKLLTHNVLYRDNYHEISSCNNSYTTPI